MVHPLAAELDAEEAVLLLSAMEAADALPIAAVASKPEAKSLNMVMMMG